MVDLHSSRSSRIVYARIYRNSKTIPPMSTRALLTGIAALLLATGTAHAQWRTNPPLRTDCRHGQIEMYLESNDAPNAEIFESEGHVTVRIDYEAFRKLLKRPTYGHSGI